MGTPIGFNPLQEERKGAFLVTAISALWLTEARHLTGRAAAAGATHLIQWLQTPCSQQ